jgi:hypothetical protein
MLGRMVEIFGSNSIKIVEQIAFKDADPDFAEILCDLVKTIILKSDITCIEITEGGPASTFFVKPHFFLLIFSENIKSPQDHSKSTNQNNSASHF